MPRVSINILLVFAFLLVNLCFGQKKKELNILLVTGGCCHNYELQADVIKALLPNVAHLKWTVLKSESKGTDAQIPLYDQPNWSAPYDLVIHNECFADTKDTTYIRKITDEHFKGKNAIVIHCAMHTYRSATTDEWRKFLGVTSKRHEHLDNYEVTVTDENHPIMANLAKTWITPKDELYVIEEVWPNTEALATSKSKVDGKSYPVVWTNKYGKAKIFGISFGHSDETFQNANYLTILRRGISWALKQ